MPASSIKPTPKVAAVGAGGGIATLLVIVAQFAKIDLPPEVAAAVVLIATFAFGFFKRDTSSPAATKPKAAKPNPLAGH
jgi:hypothetical protein